LTARLYGEAAAMLALDLTPPWGRVPAFFLNGPRLTDFPEAGRGFLERFSRALLESLRANVAAGLQRQHPEMDDSELQSAARRWTLECAIAISPERWRDVLLETANEPSETTDFCHSCSTSLHVKHHRGAASRYCRYCADETGRLRPREDVERILTNWIANWQGAIGPEEARRRARSLMAAMPAWSSN
jgi:hypothetical protein